MGLFKTASLAMSGVVANAIKMAVGTWTLQLGAMSTAGAFFSSLLGGIGTLVGTVVAGISWPVVAAVAAVAALGVIFWKLADPLTALIPLVSAVMNAFKGIAGALLQGDFAGAFELMAGSIRTIMFAAARGVIDIAKNMLTNLIGLVTGTSDGIGGAMSGISSAASRIFGEVYEAGKLAFTALASFAGDVFNQAPQIIGYAFGLAIRKIGESIAAIQNWMGSAFASFVETLYTSFANMGPGLLKAMLTGDLSGIGSDIATALRKSVAAQTLALGGLTAGLMGGEAPEFKMSPETVAAYEKISAALPTIESPEIDAKSIEEFSTKITVLRKQLESGEIDKQQFDTEFSLRRPNYSRCRSILTA